MSNKQAPAFAPAPIVDALRGLSGDKAAHCASVAGIVGAALAQCAQHGNIGPLQKAAVYIASIKGTAKGALAVRDAFAAAMACAAFLTYGTADGTVTDTSDRKRGDKPAADALAEEAAEAFALAYGTRFNAPSDKPQATAAEKARKALAVLVTLTPTELGKLLADADAHGKLADACSRAVGIIAAQKAAEGAKAAAARVKGAKGDDSARTRRVRPVTAEARPVGAALTSAIAAAMDAAGVPTVSEEVQAA